MTKRVLSLHGKSPRPESITLIAARASNGVIGVAGGLPWHLPADLKFFKEQTRGKAVVMGRRTYQSIGRPLPDRRNIVVSASLTEPPPGTVLATSLKRAFELAAGAPVMVIGGAGVYAAALPYSDALVITEVDLKIQGDTFFPDFDENQWREVWRQHLEAKPDLPALTFRRLERR